MADLLVLLFAVLTFAFQAPAQTPSPPPISCPVMPSLASSRLPSDQGDHIVIWYQNQSNKTIRGAHFELFMLDGVANRYAAYGPYIAEGEVKPQNADFVTYPTKREEDRLGDAWSLIKGVEVRVTRVLFKDGSVWVPRKGQTCKATFMNDEYDAEIVRRLKRAEEKPKKKDK